MKYSKGPWHQGEGNGEGSIFNDDGRMRLEIGGTTLFPICIMVSGWDDEEDQANAQLVAAAPDMYKALKQIANMPQDAQRSVLRPSWEIAQEILDEIERNG